MAASDIATEKPRYNLQDNDHICNKNLERLQTFAACINILESAISLSNNGFKFDTDKIVCVDCNFEVYDYAESRNIINRHCEKSPLCPFVQEYLFKTHGHRMQELKSDQDEIMLLRKMDAFNGSDFFAKKENRTVTFRDWPVTFISIEELVDAGFYYTGDRDKVRCYKNGCNLCEWQNGDNPVTEHHRWYETCPLAIEGYNKILQDIEDKKLKTPDKVLEPSASRPAIDSWEAKFEELQIRYQCKVCMDDEIGITFLPCGHCCCCYRCGSNSAERRLDNCPICRCKIRGVIRTRLS